MVVRGRSSLLNEDGLHLVGHLHRLNGIRKGCPSANRPRPFRAAIESLTSFISRKPLRLHRSTSQFEGDRQNAEILLRRL